ncbi:alpha/beta hydrolase [Pedobacter caeni]|uniref:Acetyl esterase/lipase n=1 Tax=Pedobacter caeni TaxID=288992 RepID=A0A1M4UEZ5_9SPHI|nr:alpha/beta hydrolase [Pedobacter caeni]SHE55188.1 Acetyl esterase/lipase [Pedobacter caeni]
MKKRACHLFILLIVLSGCSTARKASNPVTEQKLKDVVYGEHPRNIMDVYLPAGRNEKTPFVVLIHGGAWVKAGKEDAQQYADSLFSNRIAFVSINYRYANSEEVHYPEMLEDIDKALNYCIAHASQWNTRKNNFTMTGGSSGAHMAMLYSYTTNKKIKAIVDFCGPSNLTDSTILNYSAKVGLIGVIQMMTGKRYLKGQLIDPAYALSSPITQVKDIPILMVHGTADPVVDFSQSRQLSDQLEAKNITHKLLPIPGAGHDLNLKDAATRALVYGEAIKWIYKYGK